MLCGIHPLLERYISRSKVTCITSLAIIIKGSLHVALVFFVRQQCQQRLRSTPLRCSRTVLGRQFPNTGIMTRDPVANSLPVQKSTYFLMFLVSIFSSRGRHMPNIHVIENDTSNPKHNRVEKMAFPRGMYCLKLLWHKRGLLWAIAACPKGVGHHYSWKVGRFLDSVCESSLMWCNIFTEICVYLEYSCGVLAIQVTKIAPPICALRSGNLMYIIVLINSTTPHSISSIPGKWGLANQLPMHILWGTISSCICWFVGCSIALQYDLLQYDQQQSMAWGFLAFPLIFSC